MRAHTRFETDRSLNRTYPQDTLCLAQNGSIRVSCYAGQYVSCFIIIVQTETTEVWSSTTQTICSVLSHARFEYSCKVSLTNSESSCAPRQPSSADLDPISRVNAPAVLRNPNSNHGRRRTSQSTRNKLSKRPRRKERTGIELPNDERVVQAISLKLRNCCR